MTARSELGALSALGARLRAAGSPSAARVTAQPYPARDVADGLTRLRAFAGGEAAPNPGTHAEPSPAEIAAYMARRYSGRGRGMSGWRQVPQCGGCKKFLPHPGAQCPSCGYLAGGGYFAVPAKTSYLERYR